MTENWDELYKRLPPELSMLGSMVQITTSGFTKPEQLAQVEEFFKNKKTNGYDQSLAQSLDSVRSKISWLNRDRGDVADWVRASKSHISTHKTDIYGTGQGERLRCVRIAAHDFPDQRVCLCQLGGCGMSFNGHVLICF